MKNNNDEDEVRKGCKVINKTNMQNMQNYVSKTSFADVVKQSVQNHHLTKDDVFKGFMSIMYASHKCAGSADIFQSTLDHLFKKKNYHPFP